MHSSLYTHQYNTGMYIQGSIHLSRVRLSKRRGKAARSAMNSKLVVRHRDMTDEEVMAQVRAVAEICH